MNTLSEDAGVMLAHFINDIPCNRVKKKVASRSI